MAMAMAAGGGCDAGNTIEREQLARSRTSWNAVKGGPQHHYRYSNADGSFSGARWETRIEVIDDRVTARAFMSTDPSGTVAQAWTEEGAAIGSHTGAAPALTIDQVYDRCAAEVLTKDPATNRIVLEFRDDGVLGVCLYVPKNCADDCAVGYRISTLEIFPAS